MFTFFFIIFMIVVICLCAKKDNHNEAEDTDKLSKLPSFVVNAKPMSTFSKFINLAVSEKELLQSFSYSNQSIRVVMQDGTVFSNPLKDIFVDFDKVQGLITYKLKTNSQKITFYHTTNISNKEWEAINSVLCLAGSTRGRDLVSRQAKYAGYLTTAIKAINSLS